MPSLAGATGWLNSEPLDADELRGRVVLADFWTLTCINWLRTEPYVRRLVADLPGDGLVVLGVHTPEFSFEHEIDRVRRRPRSATSTTRSPRQRLRGVERLRQPLLAGALLRRQGGVIRDHHFGEGRYEQSEREIQRLLGIDRDPVPVNGVGVEAEADWDKLRSPETYLGYERTAQFALPVGAALDKSQVYELPQRLPLNQWALAGEWTIRPEAAVLDRAGGSIAYQFHARDAHLVLSSTGQEPIPFRVLLDGEAPGASHGVDVDENGDGVLRAGRMYQLVRQAGEVAASEAWRSPSSSRGPRRTCSRSDSHRLEGSHGTVTAGATP
jgi:thiol-disulfide isomerase/thioredoxin